GARAQPSRSVAEGARGRSTQRVVGAMTSTRRSGGNTASMRIRSALGLAGLTFALGTAPAVAQEPVVFIDPGSPSAKEYALPFESERRQADPGTPQGAAIPQGQRVSPAFGE